jgi:hypothetical protein
MRVHYKDQQVNAVEGIIRCLNCGRHHTRSKYCLPSRFVAYCLLYYVCVSVGLYCREMLIKQLEINVQSLSFITSESQYQTNNRPEASLPCYTDAVSAVSHSN